ncbi:hypothetical protein NPA08_01170 [Mycoplasmopsis citelli]|uniref:hypothetical protein n=1 Tax=Mycoplasmopsis citelli TaxID=171281 RepID=UPI00211458A5|nr:hypothetical protein [Mycoplasmopsis citelli]UUD36433.1 hypothetical protein NPA08_01170 [Mycoplasmopsis citelli]
MKKKLIKFLYSGAFFASISAVAISCSNSQNQETAPGKPTNTNPENNNNPLNSPQDPTTNNQQNMENSNTPSPSPTNVSEKELKGEHIDFSKSLFEVAKYDNWIVKDLSESGLLNKLELVPNGTNNSIDLKMIDYSEEKDAQSKNELVENFISYYFDLTNFWKAITFFKLGEITQGTQKDKVHQFYEKDHFLVQDSSGKWVNLDFKKTGQYLPTKLDKDGNLEITYKIQHQDTNELITYHSTIEISKIDPKDPKYEDHNLSNEVLEDFEKFITQESDPIGKAHGNMDQYLVLANTYKLVLNTLDDKTKKVLDEMIHYLQVARNWSQKFVQQVEDKALTVGSVRQWYVQVNVSLAYIFEKAIGLLVDWVNANRNLSEEEIKTKIDQLKEILTKAKNSSNQLPIFKMLENLLTKYEDLKSKDSVLLTQEDLTNKDKLIVKWLGIENEKDVYDLKLKAVDVLLLFDKVFEFFKPKQG